MVVQEVVQYAENIESEADLYAQLGFFPLELLSILPYLACKKLYRS